MAEGGDRNDDDDDVLDKITLFSFIIKKRKKEFDSNLSIYSENKPSSLILDKGTIAI